MLVTNTFHGLNICHVQPSENHIIKETFIYHCSDTWPALPAALLHNHPLQFDSTHSQSPFLVESLHLI